MVGKRGQRPARNATPEDSDLPVVIRQLCCPPRRQQAGRVSSPEELDNTGISEKLNRTTSKTAGNRRIGLNSTLRGEKLQKTNRIGSTSATGSVSLYQQERPLVRIGLERLFQ